MKTKRKNYGYYARRIAIGQNKNRYIVIVLTKLDKFHQMQDV